MSGPSERAQSHKEICRRPVPALSTPPGIKCYSLLLLPQHIKPNKAHVLRSFSHQQACSNARTSVSMEQKMWSDCISHSPPSEMLHFLPSAPSETGSALASITADSRLVDARYRSGCETTCLWKVPQQVSTEVTRAHLCFFGKFSNINANSIQQSDCLSSHCLSVATFKPLIVNTAAT